MAMLTRVILQTFLGFLISLGPAAAQEQDVVSISGVVTEIVYALGQEHRLAARDTTSTYPNSAQALPDVGYLHNITPEGVLSVNPSLILADEAEGPPEIVDLLKASRVDYIEVPQGFDEKAVIDRVMVIARALGAHNQGNVLTNQIKRDFALLATQTDEDKTPKPRVLFILSSQNGNLRVAGSHTSVHHMIALAGGINVASGLSGYQTMATEAVIASQPDVILAATYANGSSPITDQVSELPALAPSPAAEHKAIMWFDALALTGFGPRTARIANDMHKAISK